MGITRTSALALLFMLACKGSDKPPTNDNPTSPARPAAPTGDSSATPAPAGPQSSAAAPRQIEAPPPPKLHDKPVERRLYSDRIEASSFLWTDWNKFQENYHPNYVLDGDPATAWVEGADTSGAAEWIRIHVSPVEGASKIRLRVRNGYHKSKALHGKNARLKKVELVALPSGVKHTAEVADSMAWQELAFVQPAGKLEALELRALEVVEGSKYTDLCISDVELYVTGLTVENPAFEKSKLDALLAWKKKRLEAAKLIGDGGLHDLPIGAGYRVVKGEKVTFTSPNDGKPYPRLRATLTALAKHAATARDYAEAAKRATAALESDFAGWVKVQVVARTPLELPEVDGLSAAENEELVYGGGDGAFLMPVSDQGNLLRSADLSTFDTKGKNPKDETECKRGKSEFLRPPRRAEDGPVVREILHVKCVTEETREGEAAYMVWQLLEYEANGNLVLTVGPHDQVQWFEWQDGKRALLQGGGRLQYEGDELQRLVAAAPKP